jgi:adenosine deaminase
MVNAGLLCTLNSDDPPMFGTTLNDEYRKLHRQGFTLDELRQLNLNAVESCFLPAGKKEALRIRVNDSSRAVS